MNLTQLEAAARSKTSSAFDYSTIGVSSHKSWIESRIQKFTEANILLVEALKLTRWNRRRNRLTKLLTQNAHYIIRDQSSLRFNLEHRAIRRDDNEYFESQGWFIFHWVRSDTYRSDTQPIYCAERSLRWIDERLKSVRPEVETKTERLEYFPGQRIFHAPWWSESHATIALLIRCETPAELHQYRLAYLEAENNYWSDLYKRYNWSGVPTEGRFPSNW